MNLMSCMNVPQHYLSAHLYPLCVPDEPQQQRAVVLQRRGVPTGRDGTQHIVCSRQVALHSVIGTRAKKGFLQ